MARTKNHQLGKQKDELESFLNKALLITSYAPFKIVDKSVIAEVFKCAESSVKNIRNKQGLKIDSISLEQLDAISNFFQERLFKEKTESSNVIVKKPSKADSLSIAEKKKLEDELDAICKRIRSNPLVESEQKIYSYQQIAKEAFVGIPETFIGSSWMLFERHEKEKHAFGRKILTFSKGKVAAEVRLVPNLSEEGDWVGQAYFVHDDRLMTISLFNEKTKNKFFHILIKIESASKHPEICIGHQTLKNIDNKNVVTKLIVLQRIPKGTAIPEARTFDLKTTEIKEPIRDLLFDRGHSRLSSPHKVAVYNLETLRNWHTQNNTYDGKRYLSIEGNYTIYYRTKAEEEKLIKDQLKLKRISESELYAEYNHVTTEPISSLWVGYGFINLSTHTINLYLKGPFDDKLDYHLRKGGDDRPIFLIVDLPKEDVAIDFLVGIASGPRDKIKGTVARLIGLKKSAEDEKDIEPIIKEFFRLFANKLRVRPPSKERIYNLQTLNDEITSRTVEEKTLSDKQKLTKVKELLNLKKQWRKEWEKEFYNKANK